MLGADQAGFRVSTGARYRVRNWCSHADSICRYQGAVGMVCLGVAIGAEDVALRGLAAQIWQRSI